MTIQELKVTSFLMTSLFSFSNSAKEIAGRQFGQNLTMKEGQLILKFLNEWGCRQFKKENHKEAAKSLIDWHNRYFKYLPNHSSCLINKKEEEIAKYIEIFDALKESYASKDKRGTIKTFGPIGAAKALFALRKNMFVPWDNAIIKGRYLPNGKSYVDYLLNVRIELLKLKEECQKRNIEFERLPITLNNHFSSLVKLIDDYYWLTITRSFKPDELINLIKSNS